MEMGSLERLQHFFASFNNLTGPLEGRFCVKDNTRLKSLILRANQFTGTINMSHCLGLELLDVQVCLLSCCGQCWHATQRCLRHRVLASARRLPLWFVQMLLAPPKPHIGVSR